MSCYLADNLGESQFVVTGCHVRWSDRRATVGRATGSPCVRVPRAVGPCVREPRTESDNYHRLTHSEFDTTHTYSTR